MIRTGQGFDVHQLVSKRKLILGGVLIDWSPDYVYLKEFNGNIEKMTIKNIWSLNVDEAIVAEKLKKELGKRYEVFFPINSQLKDIDLLIQNPKTGKSKSINLLKSEDVLNALYCLQKLGVKVRLSPIFLLN